MGRPTKKQSRKPYNYDRNRRKEWHKRKKLPAIKCKEMKNAWDRNKSMLKNMEEMGLSADPNKTLRIKTTKELITPMEVEEVSLTEVKQLRAKKEHVAKAIEVDANRPAAKTNKLSEPEVQYCTYMLDKYGDDYKAMARDPRNHYQETPKQIKKKINMFKNTSVQYEAYLKCKVEDACGTWRQVCCSPVSHAELRGLPVSGKSSHQDRRVTRKYEAARKNGHYEKSPEMLNGDETEVSRPVSLSRVRRKLHFGRKPPKNREASVL